MRTFVGLFAGGAIALIIFKILAALIFPFLGMFIGVFVTAVKLLLLAGVVYLVYSLIFKRKKEREEAEA
jgi:hypothetical protein